MQTFKCFNLSLKDQMANISLSLRDDSNAEAEFITALPKDAFRNGDFTPGCKTLLAMRCTKQVAGLAAYAQVEAIIHYSTTISKIVALLKDSPPNALYVANELIGISSKFLRSIDEDGINAFALYRSVIETLNHFR